MQNSFKPDGAAQSRPLWVAYKLFASTDRIRNCPRRRWSLAAVAFALGLSLRFWTDDLLPAGFPYLTFFPAVILTAFFGGRAPGVVVAAASGLCAWYFFIPPFDSFGLNPGAATALVFYVVIVTVDVSLIHWMHQVTDRLREERETAARFAAERDTLFKEMQHRVSNNLAVISSMLSAQARGLGGEAAAALAQAAARVNLVAKIQRQLYDPSRQSVEFGPYLESLGADLLGASDAGHVTYRVEAEPVRVPAHLAVPLGLIATELIANAVEHGFAGARRGVLRVDLRRDAADGVAEVEGTPIRFSVSDDGPGWPDGFSVENTGNLGMRIIASLTQQLRGDVALRNEGGAVAVVRFVLPDEDLASTPA
ncbi:DUF4118 domain-containing protein [Aurantimonas sp. MSK8Z-1]|uniref:sensor histidine kinase n=1 Tax=Mangrovibrevibacter kandeliae TaxID=2968473 RepID=UPI0021175E2F|nr:DUF4118 domain-containing protein [Aurantimonas sp. MSK8Z-1]MCW4113766.1 DUF4118 domain-containing protein [Aurantimonas sp. MSK8Z-1]